MGVLGHPICDPLHQEFYTLHFPPHYMLCLDFAAMVLHPNVFAGMQAIGALSAYDVDLYHVQEDVLRSLPGH